MQSSAKKKQTVIDISRPGKLGRSVLRPYMTVPRG